MDALKFNRMAERYAKLIAIKTDLELKDIGTEDCLRAMRQVLQEITSADLLEDFKDAVTKIQYKKGDITHG